MSDGAPQLRYTGSVSRVLQLRDRLMEEELFRYAGFRPQGESLEEMVRGVTRLLPRVTYATAYESMRHLAGVLVSRPVLMTEAWRLAGNLPALQRGEPVLPWTAQRECEAVPVQVLGCELSRARSGSWGANFRMRIMAGSPCPMTINRWWSQGLCGLIARRAGYTSWRHGYPFSHMSELVNMRLLVQLDPEHSRAESPGFREVGCTGALQKWNKRIIQFRFRRQGQQPWPCPEGYDHHCHECHVGYLDCPAATHRETREPNT